MISTFSPQNFWLQQIIRLVEIHLKDLYFTETAFIHAGSFLDDSPKSGLLVFQISEILTRSVIKVICK